jgi:hypothetical protein
LPEFVKLPELWKPIFFLVGHIFRAFLVASGSAVAMAASKIAWTSLSD